MMRCPELRVVYVTSSVTYVQDNYFHLLDSITRPDNLSPGIKVVGVVYIKVPRLYLLKNVLGLFCIGAPRFSLALWRNLCRYSLNDPRQKLLAERCISLFQTPNINLDESLKHLSSLNPHLIINLRTRNIYKRPVLDLPKIGCLNIHHGLLPDNRGTMCDLWAWLEKRPVGFTLHWMNEKIDDGEIVTPQEIDVQGIRNYLDIPLKSSHSESGVLLSALTRIQHHGKTPGIPNRTEHQRYTRNPTFAQIAQIRKQGLFL